jgi:hypothetical protein
MTKQEVLIMKGKITSVLAILLVFFATFGTGLAMAQENETTDNVTETVDDITQETEDEVEEEEISEEELEEIQEELTEAEEEANEAEEEIEEEAAVGEDTEQSEEYSEEANTLVEEATDAFAAGDYKKARKLAKDAKKKALQAKRGKAFKKMKLLHLYDVFFHQMEKHRIGMEAIIEYANVQGDVNAGSEQLVIIKDKFVVLETDLETAANADDDSEFRQILKDARGLTKDFKDEAHDALGTEGAIGEARTKVNEALDVNADYLKTLKENIQNSREESELELVDDVNEEIEEKIEKAKEEGVDTEEFEARLEELKDKREELEAKLEAAIASCEDVSIDECDTLEAEEYQTLKEEIKVAYKEIRETSRKTARAKKVSSALRQAQKVVERLEAQIAKAEEEGADVTVLKAKLEEIKAMLESTETRYDEEGYEGALSEFNSARDAFKTTRADFIKKAKERREQIKEKAEERREEIKEDAEGRRDELKNITQERRDELREQAEERKDELRDLAEERKDLIAQRQS